MACKYQTLATTLVVFFLSLSSSSQNEKASDNVQGKWQKLIPQMAEMLEVHCPDEAKGMRIVQLADLTGDGVPEALVEYCHMGAYTSDLTLMQMVNGRPVEAKFRDQAGKLASVGLLQGASVRNGEDTKLLPEKHAIYVLHWHTDDSGALAACTVDAYVWSPKSATFDLKRKLGKEIAKRECLRLQNQVVPS